ncbi:MAG: sulfatase-like hydrolase/transferase [Bacteroidota bacterium]
MKTLISTTVLLLSVFLISCNPNETTPLPNVILIMADDMGYECVGSYGSESYETPNLDQLASEGIQFSTCIAQPLCTPSRVKIMTGKYNYRNYEYFGHLDLGQYTFGNLFKDAGYSTCIAGKWQLNGLSYKDILTDWNDATRPNQFGFDEYSLWQLTQERSKGERFANPLIEQNGELLERNTDDYGPDIFANFILDFIERKKDGPFFVYYPMVLVHDPFVPTPDSDNWQDQNERYRNDTTYFKDMVTYTDKIVGKIADQLKALNIEENTLLIFTADNGTHPTIYSRTNGKIIQGGKGNTTDAGTLVPLIAKWPTMIKESSVFDGIIEFSDFFPTLADIVGKEVTTDGHSFYPLLLDQEYTPRETAFVHYDPKWGANVSQYRNQFARTVEYKLYQDGKFYHLPSDPLEQNPLGLDSLSNEVLRIKKNLENELKRHPEWEISMDK